MLPFMVGTVFFGMFVFLGLNIPFALRTATADDDLPLVMLTGVSPLALWRARVASAALPAFAIPLVHLPLLVFLYTMGGVQPGDFGSVAVFWIAGWLLIIGWSSLAGCVWTGAARDRMQGLALTFVVGFIHVLGVALVARMMAWMNSPWVWWTLQSFQPPWRGTMLEFVRLGVHVLIGGLSAWTSVIVLRGRWRSAVEVGSNEREPPPESRPIALEKASRNPSHFEGDVMIPRGWAPVRPRCGANPWFWKDFHVSGGSWFYWWARVATALAMSLLVMYFLRNAVRDRYVEPVIVLTMVGWFIWVMFDIGQVFTVEFQDRMWSIVRITPNSVSTIFWNKMLACAGKLAPSLIPLGLVLAFGLTTYAWTIAAVGAPVLFLACVPISALILYGSVIPQTLIGAGWPMVRTLGTLAVAMALYIGTLVFLGHAPHTFIRRLGIEEALIFGWGVSVLMSVGSTIWLIYATLCELNEPRRELQSSDGG